MVIYFPWEGTALENDEVSDDEEYDLCERCGEFLVESFGQQVCWLGCSPTEGAPLDSRLLLRVSAADHKYWLHIAEFERSLSTLIREVVNQYVASPVPGFDFWELDYSVQVEFYKLAKFCGVDLGFDLSQLREMTRRDKTIELRVSTPDLQRWTRAAQAEDRSLSGMIRRAVTRHAWHYMDIHRYGMSRGG